MSVRSNRTNGALCAAKKPRFCSAITPHITALLKERYQGNQSVDKFLEWLKQHGCSISRRSYHEFVHRVLCLMSMKQARDLGVDVELLRAVRVRGKLPIDPKGVRAVTGKPTPRHDSRARRRRILPRRESRLVGKSLGHSTPKKNPPAATSASTPPREIELPTKQSEAPKMRGTPEDPQGHGDWKIINDMARKKVFSKDRSVMLNYQGTVLHTKTRHEYTQAELEAQFGLTPNEAESCFMTFTAAERSGGT